MKQLLIWIAAVGIFVLAAGWLISLILHRETELEPVTDIPEIVVPMTETPTPTATSLPPTWTPTPVDTPTPTLTPTELPPEEPTPPTMEQAWKVEGVVINMANAPVEGATVEIRLLGELDGWEWTAPPVVTAFGGRFEFFLPQLGRYELFASREDYARGGTQVEFKTPGVQEAKIILRPGDAIHGTVYENITGRKLENVLVIASARRRIYAHDEHRPQMWVETRTKADGSYLLEGLLPDQNYLLIVSNGDHAPEIRQDILAGTGPLDFYLNPGASISGKVLWEDDRTPVANATVQIGMGFELPIRGRQRLEMMGIMGLDRLPSSVSDSSGVFSIGGLPGRRLPVYASIEAETSLIHRSQPQWVELQNGQETTGIELLISRQAPKRLHGIVRDMNRTPVAGVVVRLQGAWGGIRRTGQDFRDWMSMLLGNETLTAEDGSYEFTLPGTGRYRVEAAREGFFARAEGAADVDLTDEQAEYELNFTLFTGTPVEGNVRDDETGEGIEKVLVIISRHDTERDDLRRGRPIQRGEVAETDAQGKYRFPGVEPGEYLIQIDEAPPGYAIPTRAVQLTVEVEKPAVQDFVLRKGVSLGGRILYPDGRPASGARVSGISLEPQKTLNDESDVMGRYELTGFPKDSEVYVLVRPLDFPELNPAPLLSGGIFLNESVLDHDLRLPEAGKIVARVTNEDGQPLLGQRVRLQYQSTVESVRNFEDTFSSQRTTNREGQVEFDGLTTGSWKASVLTRREPVEALVEVSEGGTFEVILTIPNDALVDNSGVLSGRVRFEDGSPARQVRVSARMVGDPEGVEDGTSGDAWTNADGRFRIQGLRQSREFVVEVRLRTDTIVEEGILTSNTALDLVVPSAGVLAVRILDADGRFPGGDWNAFLFRMERDGLVYVFQPPEILDDLVLWERLGRGTYQVLVAGQDVARTLSKPIEVLPDQQADEIILQIPRPADFIGTVVDSVTGQGIPGVEILEELDSSFPGARWVQYLYQKRTFSNSFGEFEVKALPPGYVKLRLRHPMYHPMQFEADQVPSNEVMISLQRK